MRGTASHELMQGPSHSFEGCIALDYVDNSRLHPAPGGRATACWPGYGCPCAPNPEARSMPLISLIIFLLAALAPGSLSADRHRQKVTEDRTIREIRMGERAILSGLMVARNPKSRYLCTQNEFACIGPDRIDLGLAVISSRNEAPFVSKLMDLLRYKIDGAGAEDLHCAILNKGSMAVTAARSINPAELARRCKNEFSEILSEHPGSFDSLRIIDVCSERIDISSDLDELLVAIGEGRKCPTGDF